MLDLSKITADVAAQKSIDASAVTLIQSLKTQLDAAIASNDPTALNNLSTALETEQAAFTAAITANTPAAGTGSATSTGSTTTTGASGNSSVTS